MEPPAGGDPETLKDAKQAAVARVDADGPATTSGASTTATAPSMASCGTRPPRPTPRSASRSTTGAGPACRSSSAAESGCRSPRRKSASCSSIRPASSHSRRRPRRSRIRSLFARPVHRLRARARRPCAPTTRSNRDPARHVVRDGRRREGDAVRGAAARRDEGARQPVHTTGQRRGEWRIVQPLLDSPPPVQPYAQGSWGPEQAEELVAGYGGWHGPWLPAGE